MLWQSHACESCECTFKGIYMTDIDKKKIKLNKTNRFMLIIISALIILLLMAIQYVLQVKNNRDQAYRTAEVLIDQVKNIMETNEEKEQTLIDSLKEDYITRARAVSYIIDNNSWIEDSVTELNRVAGLISVDEIHLFDTSGAIYSGTVPKYYGYSFDSGEQMAYFKPMLTDKDLALCQDVTPNTAEGKSMMYAICWNDAGTRMIQVGIEPLRLLEELRSNEISEVIADMPSYDGIDIVVADRDTWKIVASTKGVKEDALLITTKVDIEKDKITRFNVVNNGRISYCSASGYEDYIIAIVQNREAINNNIPLSTGISFAYLLLAAVILYNVFRKLTAHILEEQRNANTDPMTDLYNRRAYETAFAEYQQTPPGERFIYVSMDLNGLKQTNDNKGHDEGDRLIHAAGKCMKQCFGNYGRIFRVGGDEFVALIFDDDVHIEQVKNDFERTTKEESIRSNLNVSVSCGYVRQNEFPDKSIGELAKIADERLYKAKEEYYKTHDRRQNPR